MPTLSASRPVEIQVRALQLSCYSHSMPSDIAVAWARLIESMSSKHAKSLQLWLVTIHAHLVQVATHRLQSLADGALNFRVKHHEVDALLLCMFRGSIPFHLFMSWA